jgi:hypothetical protein
MGSVANYYAEVILKSKSKEKVLLETGEDIYCDSDNEAEVKITLTEDFISKLKAGDKLILSCSGSGEHC